MNNELLEALNLLEKEKGISKDVLLDTIEVSLMQACKNHFGSKADNIIVRVNKETCDYEIYAEKTVVEEVEDMQTQISLPQARKINKRCTYGDTVKVEIQSKNFGRIAAMNAKNVILQKIREEERNVLYGRYNSLEKEVVTGTVQRYFGKNVSINLGKVDAVLNEKEIAKGKIDALEKSSGKKVHVALLPYKNFYEAEEYHQDYYLKNPEEFEKELIESGRKKKIQ